MGLMPIKWILVAAMILGIYASQMSAATPPAPLTFKRLLMTGDSTMWGYGSNGSARVNSRVNSMPQRLAAWMNANGVPTSANSTFGKGGNTVAEFLSSDPRWVGIGRFNVHPSAVMLGGQSFLGSAPLGDRTDINVGEFDTLAITAFQYPGSGSLVNVKVDVGGVTTTIGNFNGDNPTFALKRTVFTAPSIENYQLQLDLAGDFYLIGFEAWRSTDALSIMQAGWNGQYSSDYATGTADVYSPKNSAAFMMADALIVNQGINDVAASVSQATFEANYKAYIDTVLAAKPDTILFFVIPNDLSIGLGYLPSAITSLAAFYGATVLDTRLAPDMATYLSAAAAGKMFDGLHPSGSGYLAIANYFGPIIKSVLYP